MEGYNDYSIQEEIRKLNEMMSRGARFDTIIAHIKNILNFISKNNAEDEYAHIVNIYRTDSKYVLLFLCRKIIQKHCYFAQKHDR